MVKAGVYAIVNTVNGDKYIGSAVNIRQRWRAHKSALNNGTKAPPKLQKAWSIYGAEAFSFVVLEHCAREDTLTREQFWLDRERPAYNTRTVAESNLNVKWSESTNAAKGRAKVLYTFNGVTGSLRKLAKLFSGVTYECVRTRMKNGMSLELALTTEAETMASRAKKSVASRKECGSHQKFTAFGVRGTLKELTDKFGKVSIFAVRARLARGKSIEDALTTPTPSGAERTKAMRSRAGVDHPAAKVITALGKTGSIRQMSDEFGICYSVALKRLSYGWSADKTFSTPVAKRKKRNG